MPSYSVMPMLCANCCKRYGAVFVVVVFREGVGHVRGGVAGLQLFESRVHGIVHFAVQIDFLLGHLHALRTAALEAAHEVDEVARRSDGVNVHDHQVALADQFVGGPAAIRAGVAAGSDDDVVNDFAAALQHEFVHFGFDFALAHARLQPFVLDLPHGRIADAGSLLQQLDFIHGLDDARLRNRRPAIHDFQAGLLERLESGHIKVVDADALFGYAMLFQHFHNALGHAPGHVRHGAFGPLPGDRRTNAAFHPRQIDFGAVQVRARGFKQHRLARVGDHRDSEY